MKIFLKILLVALLFSSIVKATSLQKMYDNAQPYGAYDKLIILQDDVIYTGGFIQDVEKVCIQGNGAIIDLLGENIVVDGENKEIEIHHCIFISSLPYETYVLLKNDACGHFINNTFYSIEDSVVSRICLRFEECTAGNSLIYNNIFVNFSTAVFFYTLDFMAPIALEISNNDIWHCDDGYMYWGGWTGFPTTFIPSPGNSEIIDDPQFVDTTNLNFNLQSGSSCIDRGTDFGYSFNSFDPDLGAKESEYSNFIGTKISGTLSGDLIADASPYIVEDDIIVSSGSELRILPGTVLKINTSKSILVYGSLILEGSDTDSIYIKQNSVYEKYWGGIVFFPEASKESIISKSCINNGAPQNGKGVIYCSNDSITVCNNCFSNMATTIYCENNSYPRISNNIFNEASNFSGVRVIYCASNSRPLIENNVFFCSSVFCVSAKPIIKRNKFMGQSYSIAQQYWLLTLTENSDAYLEANLFKNNYGAVLVISSTCASYNNLVNNCTTSYLFDDNAIGHIYNNTIYPENFGIRCARNSTVNIINSIVWKYGVYGYALQIFDSSKIYSEYCILSDVFEGENNFYEDPLFVNSIEGDFHLSSESPGIDAGTIDTTGLNLPQTDYDNMNRVTNGRIDIGCYEFTDPNSIKTYYQEFPDSYCLEQNYPNPFNPITRINYFVPQISFVTLKIFDMLGKEIATLVNEEKPAGSYEVEFNTVETHRDASLPSGIYFYRLQAGSFNDTKKLILIK